MKIYFQIILILSLFSISIFNCSKTKIKQLEPTMRFYFYNTSLELELLKDTKLSAKIVGKVKSSDNLEVTAYIEIFEKNASYANQSFFEVTCPDRIKADCKNGKAYFSADKRLGADVISWTVRDGRVFLPYDTVGTIVGKSDFTTLEAIRSWLRNPEQVKSIDLSNVKFELFNTALALEFPKVDDRLKVVNEILLFPEVLKHKNAKDHRYQYIYKQYIGLRDKNKKSSGIVLPSRNSNELFDNLQEQQVTVQTQLFLEYPARGESFKELVNHFNKYKNHYLIQENLFQRITTNGIYEARGLNFPYFSISDSSNSLIETLKRYKPNVDIATVVANGKLEFKGNEGVFLKISNLDLSGNVLLTEALEVLSISAVNSGGSIGFQIKLNIGELVLTPLATSDYLLTSGQGFKEFLETVPQDSREIFKTNSYEKSVLLSSVKFGEGGYLEELGRMRYILNTGDKFGLISDMILLNPNLIKDSESSGTFSKNSSKSSDGYCYNNFKWRLTKGNFYMSATKTECESESASESIAVEELCLANGSGNNFYITFTPADMRSDKPKVELELGTPEPFCEFLNLLVFGTKPSE
ncbi:MAG: hypothetical protein KBF93_23075 [Leptospiraceae bacterium]|jgi:hypothetical protein|nr:hypothetical protein [Leptospiraceae bacterium]